MISNIKYLDIKQSILNTETKLYGTINKAGQITSDILVHKLKMP